RDGIWPADVRQEVHAMLERNVDALALVDRTAPLPFEEFESGVPFNPLAGQLMLLEQLCDRRAALLALDGQGDRAVAPLYCGGEARPRRELATWVFWPARFSAGDVWPQS